MSLCHALLIALQYDKGTGYEITKWFEVGMGNFWHATHQQIYKELRKMSESGWVEFETVEQSGKPAKKVYQVTDQGQQELVHWLEKPAKQFVIKDELLMKLYAGHLIPPAHLLKDVLRCRAEYLTLKETYRQIEHDLFSDVSKLPESEHYVYLTLKNGKAYIQAWLDWSDEVIEFLENKIASMQK